MSEKFEIIARIHSEYSEKFGIPRQSGMAELPAQIIFEPKFRSPDAVRGLEGFSHIWVLWQFSEAKADKWSPTVRPPRLGGNQRMGVFATRSPFRPNSIGLSSVKLKEIEYSPEKGPILHVMGADILNDTPILDIKPYLAFTDSHPDATAGFTDQYADYRLNVIFNEELLNIIPDNLRQGVTDILASDPRPSYQDDADRIYGMTVGGFSIKFTVNGNTLTVTEVSNT